MSANNGDIFIVKVKFYRRNTIVFRSDGQIDFIGSNNVVYSSRNIDFNKMRWDPATSPQILKERRLASPTISDVAIDEHDLLLISNTGVVYLFNLDHMTVSKSTIKTEQAILFPYHNRLHIFSDFMVYDNFVIVSHNNMLSICDLNAKVCKEKSWRHLQPPLTDLDTDDRDTFNNEASRKDPFRVCNLNILLIKLREIKGSNQPCILVVF